MKYKTKLQRKKIYEKALAYLNRNACMGICHVIYKYIDRVVFRNHISFTWMVRELPELLKQKPKNKNIGGGWWADGNKKSRIKALKAVIKLCDNG